MNEYTSITVLVICILVILLIGGLYRDYQKTQRVKHITENIQNFTPETRVLIEQEVLKIIEESK